MTEEVVGDAQTGEVAAQDRDVVVAGCHYCLIFTFDVRLGST